MLASIELCTYLPHPGRGGDGKDGGGGREGGIDRRLYLPCINRCRLSFFPIGSNRSRNPDGNVNLIYKLQKVQNLLNYGGPAGPGVGPGDRWAESAKQIPVNSSSLSCLIFPTSRLTRRAPCHPQPLRGPRNDLLRLMISDCGHKSPPVHFFLLQC